MAHVKLIDVTKDYPGGVRAVDRVSLEIGDREFLVLVGPSGCGKSTTLRMIAGLEAVGSGTIRIGDRVVNEVPPKDRDIAMVFQNYALYPHMTVYKNMAFSLKLRRRELKLTKADIDKKVRETAALLGIEDLLNRRPKALSGGQRQRVAVGRAIVRNPKVFLFDEPLSNLDAKLRVEMRSEIKRLQRRLATTTIYVTHDQEEAMTLGDRVVVMKDGVVQQCAPPLEIYDHPANRFVASFVGTPSMSFIEGRIVKRDAEPAFDVGNGSLSLPRWMTERLSSYADREMVLGIRPDAFSVERPAGNGVTDRTHGDDFAKLGVRITLVEPLGDRKDIYMTTEARKQLVGRVDARVSVSEGQSLEVFIDMSRAHVFEPGELGVNVTAMNRQNGAMARAN
ncbi:MAG: sn-glycerol-3-phosphate ABC transporter ATP-binding protein UgpC [Phycisphaerales bacterium]|nr:sn-glycerol-3-phosphate ABC transporter ATP-binding protein UgpC [Phycisphaerales bacterium]